MSSILTSSLFAGAAKEAKTPAATKALRNARFMNIPRRRPFRGGKPAVADVVVAVVVAVVVEPGGSSFVVFEAGDDIVEEKEPQTNDESEDAN